MQTNSVYTTPRWETPGTYTLTCSVHPDMTLKVIVTP
jgi:plastocyanin